MAENSAKDREFIIKHVQVLARQRKGGVVTVDAYNAYRKRLFAETGIRLRSPSTIYRLFGSFTKALEEANVLSGESSTQPRKSQAEIVADLRYVAGQIGKTKISTQEYDSFRSPKGKSGPIRCRPTLDENGKQIGEEQLYSSSAIRKWAGPLWRDAQLKAGLEPGEAPAHVKPSMLEVASALKQAKEHVRGRLTPAAYAAYVESLPDDERIRYPSARDILDRFHEWGQALRAADVEQFDAIHPRALYTADEVRRQLREVEQFLRRYYGDNGYQLDEDGYLFVYERRKRPMPPWEVCQDLMALG